MKIFIDTNVFLRFLLADHKTQSSVARALFIKAKEGKVRLVTHSLVIAEIVFTLDSFYELPKQQIIEKINILLLFEGLEIMEKDILLQSISFYEKKNIDFIDAFIAAYGYKDNINVCSFDKDFDKIKEITRVDPFLITSSGREK